MHFIVTGHANGLEIGTHIYTEREDALRTFNQEILRNWGIDVTKPALADSYDHDVWEFQDVLDRIAESSQLTDLARMTLALVDCDGNYMHNSFVADHECDPHSIWSTYAVCIFRTV